MKQSGDNTLINMDELSQLVAGNVNIDVNAVADSGDYFESKHAILNVVKLDSSSITNANGVLEWTRINNAKQYNLVYSNITSSGTMVLTEGSENFTIQGDKCIYNFDSLDTGMSALYLQVDSEVGDGGTYYLNSNNGEVFDSVYKLSTPEISVVNGQIYTEVRYSDLRLSHKVEMYLDGKARVEITLENVDGEDKVHVRVNGIDIGNANDDSLVITPNVDNAGITLAPGVLLQYGESELLLETLSIKAYSNNETTLNSSTYSKEIYGLLSPTNLNITTSTNISEVGAINEVLEKITWNNPSANSTYVAKYEIVINYNDIDYILYSDSTKRVMMMPTYYDTNSNGKLDAGETEFGAGNYTIKVRALTDNCNNIVNSKYCNEITVTVLKTPTNLSSKNGNIIWSNDTSVGYYLIKVYLLNGDDKQLMVSSQSSLSEFDLTTLNPFETGVYGISVQAMHDNARILASKESEVFQVIRLPQVAEYYVRNGEFYIKIHSFYTKAEVYLTDKETGSTTDTFTIENQDLTKYNQFVNNSTFVDWTSSNVINTYTNDDYFVDVKYLVDDDTTLRALTSQAYSVKVKLYGNTTTKGAIISGHTSTQAINSYWKEDASVADKNVLDKLVTPTVEVSSTERGVMLINIPDGLNYSLHYYINGTNSLQGVHLYEVHISTDKTYSIYVAEIVDNDLFEASLNAVGSSLIQDDVNRNYLKHFEYNGITFNVIDSNSAGYIPFDFNTTNYYYYAKTGEYQYIDLTIGGSFVVSLRFIGDDSRFVQSNLTDTVTIKRYSVLNIDVNNGVLSWLNQATEDDNPVYVITLSNESETYNIVLYNPAIYSQEDLVGCLESGKEYIFDTITYSTDAEVQDKVITYKGLADVVAKARNANGSQAVNVGGTFLATVKAHFTDTTSMDIILAQDGDSKTIAVLPQAQINVVDGLLSWNMSYVSTTGGNEYITNYSLQIFDGNNKLYEITLKDGTYNVSSNVATYELTKILNNGSDGDFSFVPGSNYIFKLVALGGDSKTYVNSVSSETISIQLLPDLQNVRMENGVLTWTNNTTNSVEVYVSYTMGDTAITFVVTENDNTFELPTSWTDTSETLRYLVSGYDYHIKVRLKGQTNSLNGFFSDVVCMDGETVGEETIKIYPQRLKTIDSSTIVTNNGVLTWEANSDFEGVKYVVVYTLENGETYQTNMLDTNAFDFSGVATGKISVKIFAHHNNHFTSFASNTNEKAQVVDAKTIQLFKLSVPTNIKYHEGQTKISWDKVLDADGNPVDDYMVSITQEDAETQEYKCSSNEWYITGVMSDAFSIAVKAISIDESGVEINSDYTKPQTMALPYQVDATTFEYDNELKAFKWKPIQGEQIGDTYYIGFNYYDELLSVNANANMYIEREQVAVATSEAVDYYYYYPSKIGSYRLVYIQVVRAGSLSSQQTWCVDSEGAYYGLEFNLFSSGEGTSSKPYIISKGEEFRNIKYFLDAHYELSGNIEIDYLKTNEATGDIEFYPITDSTQVFTGTINGNGNEIKGLTASQQIMFDEFGYVGLFSRVQNATFANIKLTNINLNGYLNSSTLNMGLLAGHAEDSIFQTVTITSSKIQLIKNGTTGEAGYTGNNVSVYIGAITGYAQDCTFTSCKVNLGNSEQNIILNVKGNMNTQLAVGGVAGFANNCTLTGNTDDGDTSTTFIISHVLSVSTGSTTNPTLYVGALIGVVGTSGVSLTGNSCDYAEYTSSGLVSKTNQIGQEN